MSAATGDKFLATTALEEFWDTSKPIVFLGEWCKRYNRREIWRPLSAEMAPSPWDDRRLLFDAYGEVNAITERLLPRLAEALNALHHVSHGTRYWRVLLGSWLQSYVSVIYDRHLSLRKALDAYPGLTTIGLSEQSFVAPTGTMDFLLLLAEDSYNLQIFSRILQALGLTFPVKPWPVTANSYNSAIDNARERGLRARFRRTLQALSKSLYGRSSVALVWSFFTRAEEIELFVRSMGSARPVYRRLTRLPAVPEDRAARAQLTGLLPAQDEMTRILAALLPGDIPQAFVEGYTRLCTQAEQAFPPNPLAIFSANSWHYDEQFKHWAASASERGTQLLGVQHGGNYGFPLCFPSEDFETSITDKYYTWGWSRPGTQAQIISSLPAPKLSSVKEIRASNGRDGILFVLTTSPRYLVRLPFTTAAPAARFEWQARFYSALPEILAKNFRIRAFQIDYGWDLLSRWRDRFSGVKIETTELPFLRSLEQCRIYVCDHLGTTFIESLAANKPTIIYCNPLFHELRPDAQPYFADLRTAGILHDTPESAAERVGEVYADVEGWWNEPGRQAVRRRFCERFGNAGSDPIAAWAGEFRRLARLTRHQVRQTS